MHQIRSRSNFECWKSMKFNDYVKYSVIMLISSWNFKQHKRLLILSSGWGSSSKISCFSFNYEQHFDVSEIEKNYSRRDEKRKLKMHSNLSLATSKAEKFKFE